MPNAVIGEEQYTTKLPVRHGFQSALGLSQALEYLLPGVMQDFATTKNLRCWK